MPRTYGISNFRALPVTPAVGSEGDTYWDSAANVAYVSDGTLWRAISDPPGGRAGQVLGKLSLTDFDTGWLTPPPGTFYPQDYGYGTTTDVAAINAAMIAAAASGWRNPVVELGPYTYNIGPGQKILMLAGVVLRGGFINSTGTSNAVIGVASAQSNWSVKDISITATGQPFAVMVDQACDRITISGLTVVGTTSHGIALQDFVTNSFVERNKVSGCNHGIRVRQGCHDITVRDNEIFNWKGYGVEMRGTAGVGAPYSVTVKNNHFHDPTVGDPGVDATLARQAIVAYGAATALFRKISVSDNIVNGPSVPWNPGSNNNGMGDCFGLQYVDGLTVSGNQIYGGGENGISITPGAIHVSVTGNVIDDTDGYGLQIGATSGPASHVTVTGNSIVNSNRDRAGVNGTPGACNVFVTSGSTDVTITGNELTGPMQSALRVGSNSARVIIANNNTAGVAQPYTVDPSCTEVWIEGCQTAVMAADQGIQNSTTLTPLTALSLPVGPDSVIEVDAFLRYVGLPAGDIKLALVGPAGSTVSFDVRGLDVPATAGATSGPFVAAVGDETSTGIALGATDINIAVGARVSGYVTTGTAGGTVGISFAQNAAIGTYTIVRAGGRVVIRRVE
jgi:hypothetical protein